MDTASQTARQPASPAEAIITPQAMRLVTELQRRFNPRRLELLPVTFAPMASLDVIPVPLMAPHSPGNAPNAKHAKPAAVSP